MSVFVLASVTSPLWPGVSCSDAGVTVVVMAGTPANMTAKTAPSVGCAFTPATSTAVSVL